MVLMLITIIVIILLLFGNHQTRKIIADIILGRM